MNAPALPLALATRAPTRSLPGVRDGGLARLPGGPEAPDPTDLDGFWTLSAGPHSWHSLQPEKRLLLAVLADALHVLELGRRAARAPKHRAAYAEACAWVLDDAPGWFCTFGTVCAVFDLDPEGARRAVIQRFRLGQNRAPMSTTTYPSDSGAPRRFTTARVSRRGRPPLAPF